jgi:hypothetical protein
MKNKKQRVPQRTKQNKNTRVSVKTAQPARQVLCFLSCLFKKDGRKDFRLCEIKELTKRWDILYFNL